MNSHIVRLLQLPIEHNYRMTQARTFPDIMSELENLYAKDHSLTFEVNGEVASFQHISHWRDATSEEVRDLFAKADFLTANAVYNDDTHNVEYDVYLLVDGKIATLIHVQAAIVEEEDQLKFKHATIKQAG